MSIWVAIVFCLTISSAIGKLNLSYDILEKLGAACKTIDTCKVPHKEDNLVDYRCQCGSRCVTADSCCIDSPYIQYMAKAERHEMATCRLAPSNDHLKVLMVEKCDPNWSGDVITKFMCEEQCEFSQRTRDPLTYVPVTSTHTHTTYLNYYCSVCNYDDASMKYWDITIQRVADEDSDKPDPRAIDVNNVSYDEGLQRWVVTSNGIKENLEIIFRPTEDLKDTIALCVKFAVSDCAPDWKDDYVRKMCHAYMALVFIQGVGMGRYRNVHCAMCNYVNYSSSTVCDPLEAAIYVDTFDMKPPGSFSLLLDINLNDGNRVGSINRCQSGNIYDPLSKKCRSLKCALPGYIRTSKGCTKPKKQ